MEIEKVYPREPLRSIQKKGLRDLSVTWRINTILRKASGNKPISGSIPVRFEPYSDFRGSRKKPMPCIFRFTSYKKRQMKNADLKALMGRSSPKGQKNGVRVKWPLITGKLLKRSKVLLERSEAIWEEGLKLEKVIL